MAVRNKPFYEWLLKTIDEHPWLIVHDYHAMYLALPKRERICSRQFGNRLHLLCKKNCIVKQSKKINSQIFNIYGPSADTEAKKWIFPDPEHKEVEPSPPANPGPIGFIAGHVPTLENLSAWLIDAVANFKESENGWIDERTS